MTTLKVGVREAQALRVKFGEPVFVRALLGSGVPHDQHPPFKSNQLALTVYECFPNHQGYFVSSPQVQLFGHTSPLFTFHWV